MAHCLENDKNFTLDTFLPKILHDREKVFDRTQLWDGSEYTNLQHLDDQLWSRVFHNLYGPCYTFHLSKTKEYEYVPYRRKGNPGIAFSLADDNPWTKLIILLHSKDDLPDAHVLNGMHSADVLCYVHIFLR